MNELGLIVILLSGITGLLFAIGASINRIYRHLKDHFPMVVLAFILSVSPALAQEILYDVEKPRPAESRHVYVPGPDQHTYQPVHTSTELGQDGVMRWHIEAVNTTPCVITQHNVRIRFYDEAGKVVFDQLFQDNRCVDRGVWFIWTIELPGWCYALRGTCTAGRYDCWMSDDPNVIPSCSDPAFQEQYRATPL